MLKRKCPECGRRSIKVPLIDKNYTCYECVSRFDRDKLFVVFINVISLIVLAVVLTLLLNLEKFFSGSLHYYLTVFFLPSLFTWLFIYIVTRFFVPLKLSGVKGKVRDNS